jgi:NTE family protein
MANKKLAIACQGGGSHTAFTAGVLKKFLAEGVHKQYDIMGISGTSGGAICAITAWYGLLQLAKGSQEPPYKWLVDFWKDNSANLFWEQCLNSWIIQSARMQDSGMMPTYTPNPYASEWMLNMLESMAPRKEYLDFQSLLEKHINFQEIERLLEPSSPQLLLGAVDILSGEFKAFDSRKPGEISVEAVMASAAIPTIFKAVEIGKGAYWDGLFSENPPVSEFFDEDVNNRPDEIWIIQINPKSIKNIPKAARDILDRRNELAGNLSLYQEVDFIELINKWIEEGFFKEEKVWQIKPVKIRWIEMSEEVSDSLDYASKLERGAWFIEKLMADGERQADKFLMSLYGVGVS